MMMYNPEEARNLQSGPERGGSQQRPENPQEIAEDIAHTRQEMGETVDAIEEKLSPQRVKEEAKHTVREQTVGRAEQAMHSGEQTVKQTGQSVTQTIRQHPLPAAMVGIGLGWLVVEARRSSGSKQQGQQPMHQAQAQAGHFASQAEHRAEQMGQQATHQAQQMGQQATQQAQHMGQQVTQKAKQVSQQTKGQVQGMLQHNPLGLAMVAFGVGATAGAILPGTRQEDRRLGSARETAMHKAEQKAQGTLHKAEHVVKETAHQAQQTAKQEAKKQDLTG